MVNQVHRDLDRLVRLDLRWLRPLGDRMNEWKQKYLDVLKTKVVIEEENRRMVEVIQELRMLCNQQQAEIDNLRAALRAILACPIAIPRADGEATIEWRGNKIMRIAKEALGE
jgi:predicted RNA-binding protein associated with RNAse of E/G family